MLNRHILKTGSHGADRSVYFSTQNLTEFLSVIFYAAIALQLSVDAGIGFLKPVVPMLYYYIIVRSVVVIARNQAHVQMNEALIVCALLMCFPLLRTYGEIFLEPSIKRITDGLVVFGFFYLMPIPGLAMAIILKFADVERGLLKFLYLGAPGVLVLSYLAPRAEYMLYYVSVLITGYLIPASFLAIYQNSRKATVIGFIAIAIIAVLGAAVWNRTYIAMAILIAGIAIVKVFRSERRDRRGILTVAGVILVGVFVYQSLINQSVSVESHENKNALDKFQWDTLVESFSRAVSTGDLAELFYWEGNSRAIILIDAFGDFRLSEWLFGKGLFATYYTFVERTTIELAWAQEVFRWGLIYVFVVLYLAVSGVLRLRGRSAYPERIKFLFYSIVFLRIVECFVAGDSSLSNYTVVFFTGYLACFIKPGFFGGYR